MQFHAQIIQTMTETIANKCFDSCITRPGSAMTHREKTCLASCSQKFLELRQALATVLYQAGWASYNNDNT